MGSHGRCPFVPGDVYVAGHPIVAVPSPEMFLSATLSYVEKGKTFTVVAVVPAEEPDHWVFDGGIVDETSSGGGIHFYPRAWHVGIVVGTRYTTILYDHWTDHNDDYRSYLSHRRIMPRDGEKTDGE